MKLLTSVFLISVLWLLYELLRVGRALVTLQELDRARAVIWSQS